MTNLFSEVGGSWTAEDTLFMTCLVVTILLMLYAIVLIHRKMRVIESELLAIRKDQSVISEELELVASLRKGQRAG